LNAEVVRGRGKDKALFGVHQRTYRAWNSIRSSSRLSFTTYCQLEKGSRVMPQILAKRLHCRILSGAPPSLSGFACSVGLYYNKPHRTWKKNMKSVLALFLFLIFNSSHSPIRSLLSFLPSLFWTSLLSSLLLFRHCPLPLSCSCSPAHLSTYSLHTLRFYRLLVKLSKQHNVCDVET